MVTRRTIHSRRRRLQRKKPLYKRTYSDLTPEQRQRREKSFEVLSLIRRGMDPVKASKQVGIDLRTAHRNLNAFHKTRDGWQAKKVDHVPRQMVIYEGFRKEIVEISDSRIASLIGMYHNKVGLYMKTKNFNLLKLHKKTFKDCKGKRHVLQTDPLIVIALKKKESHPEFFDIYAE